MIVAAFRQLTSTGHCRGETLAYVGIPLVVAVLALSFVGENREVEEEHEAVLEPVEGGYPLPVLTGAGPVVHEATVQHDAGTTTVTEVER
jgi:hypothetical protein